MSFLKIGVMGCGRIARLVHLNVLSRLPGSRLVALAEPDKERRTEAGRLFPEATVLADYHELLKLRDVEAVIICLPNELHAEAAIAAFQHGKHVYLEKPLSTRRDEGNGVIAAWRRSGLVGMIGLNYRFNRLYRAAKQTVQSGRLGEWVGVRSVFSSAKHVSTAWDSFGQKSNVLFDLATHHVDLLHFFFGQSVKNVSAVALPRGGDWESVMLQIELFNGPLIQSFFSSSAVEEDRFEIYGRAGKLTVDRYHSLDVEIMDPIRHSDRSKMFWQRLRNLTKCAYLLEKIRSPGHEPSYREALFHFVRAVQTNHPVRPDLWDGYLSLAVIEAVEESIRTGRKVSVRYPDEVSPPPRDLAQHLTRNPQRGIG